jgi:hypothetical protein
VATGTQWRRGGVVVRLLQQRLESILSIKDDCVSRGFVADAIKSAHWFMGLSLSAGVLALAAIAWPSAIGIGRNRLRWRKAQKLPPLKPGHEFEGWTEFQATFRVPFWQWLMVVLSLGLLVLQIWLWLFVFGGSTPESVQRIWHGFEVPCVRGFTPDQGVS